MISVDYVIIGAGYAGLHCARRLIDKGFNVLVFDMREVGGELAVFSRLDNFAEKYKIFIKKIEDLKDTIPVDIGTVIKSKPVIVSSKNGLKRFEARRALLCTGAADVLPIKLNVLSKKILGIYSLDQALRIIADKKRIGEKILFVCKREPIVELSEKQFSEMGYQLEIVDMGEKIEVFGENRVEGVEVNGTKYRCDTLVFYERREPFNPLKLKGTPVGNIAVCSYDYFKVDEHVKTFLSKF
ncbi:MAG: NAD(P)-binding protein [Archaeoglobaceae archaeon]|nr:FAD-dependent oxidoreductase [Archaeoglobaceae archaeon]MDW7989890.1 NAD(P)-binding protein [Archaeoglobaceae archaeon]